MFRRRVPVLAQSTAMDCGAVCLAMILGYHGHAVDVAACRERLGSGRDGTSAASIARVARGFGLRTRAFSASPDALSRVPLPALVHWNFNHFVVVERWSPRGVDVVDPAEGRLLLTPEEFDAGFTGVVLAFEPGKEFVRRRPAPAAGRTAVFGRLFRGTEIRGAVFQILGASFLLQILGLAFPILTKVVVDGVVPFHVTGVMPVLAAGMLVLVVGQVVTGYLRASLLIYVQGRLDSRLMTGFFGHLLSLPWRFFQQRSTGDLLARLSSNLVLREVLTGQVVTALLDGAFVVAYLALLLVLAPRFGVVALAVGAAQAALVFATTARIRELSHRELAAQAESSACSIETLRGITLLKATASEDRVMEHWTDLFHRQLAITLRRSHLSAVVDAGVNALRTGSPLLILWIGTVAVLDGRMTLGTMLGLNAVAMAILGPLGSLVSTGQRLQLASAHLDRIAEVLSAEPEPAVPAGATMAAAPGRIELRDVGFRYGDDAPWVLRGVSMVIEPGEKVALVGRTGSGKSTLASLLMLLHTPTEGEILFDGVPAREVAPATLRRRLGVVLQEPVLFSGSIRRNISFHDPDLPLARVQWAAAQAAIHDDVLALPMGYETPLEESGAGLSGGQRQRLALARALARCPAVLLLDEATSHLDAVTEAAVDDNLGRLPCTRIVIAHRMTTVRNADRIYVLDGGTVAEDGSHEELLARGGVYAALVEGQHGAAAGLA